MFDKQSQLDPSSKSSAGERITPEEERIALRCNRRELQLLDSFVASGEFRSRSQLIRAALRDFIRARSLPAAASGATSTAGTIEVPLRLRREEVETYRAYGDLVAGGRPLAEVLAELVRQGERKLEVGEIVQRARRTLRDEADTRSQIGALQESGSDLERKGVVGR